MEGLNRRTDLCDDIRTSKSNIPVLTPQLFSRVITSEPRAIEPVHWSIDISDIMLLSNLDPGDDLEQEPSHQLRCTRVRVGEEEDLLGRPFMCQIGHADITMSNSPSFYSSDPLWLHCSSTSITPPSSLRCGLPVMCSTGSGRYCLTPCL